MCSRKIIILCFLIWGHVDSMFTFDQSQKGDLNVQVDLKDVQIIALLKGGKEEYVDYDYAYDYSEMTIKPQNSTTPKPIKITSDDEDAKDNVTIATTMSTDQTTANNETLPIINSAETTHISPTNYSMTSEQTPGQQTTELSEYSIVKNVTSTPTAVNNTDCQKGHVLNQKGDCVLKLQGTGNALLKLVKLSQKLKLRRENRKNQEDSA